jgi:HK97 family phage major capsid protein
MSQLAKLRAERQNHIDAAQALMAKHPTNMPQDAATEVDRLLGEAEKVGARISAHAAAIENAAPAWRDAEGNNVTALHTVEDIRSHYAKGVQASGRTPGEDFRLDDFVRGVAGMKTSTAVSAALSVGTDASGGYAVPSIVMPGILEALVPASSLLSAGAGIIPLAEGAKNFTTAAVDTIPTAAWRLERGNIAESEPTFRAVVAAPKSLAFYFKASRELLADATNMTAALTVAIAQAFAKELDRAGLRGSGTNPEPRGILNTPGIKTVANGANGAALAGFANFFTAAQELLQVNAPMPTAAIMSPRSLVKLGGLADTTGQPLRRPDMLADMRFISTPAVPDDLTVGTATNASEIYVGDFTKLVFMMREQMSIQVAKELFATTGEIGFICHVRADVAVLYPSAFAVVTGVKP